MDGFNTKFIKLVNDIKSGEILSNELDKYVKDNSNKNIFKKCILNLLDNKDEYVKAFACKYCFDYDIDKKKAYDISRYILRNSKDKNSKIEAKYVYDRYKKRYVTKITKLIMNRKLKKS